ncbi:RNase A-like domain-containing protein [Enterobacter sp.]|uniref:RNase A-like domain-containing protein n=1 Tax=Enterobacter sp. TaxID=42895 RepID=UPI003D10A4D1
MWDHEHDAQITKSARIISANRTELLSSHTHKMRVVLELQLYNNKPYYVLTAFPVLR